MNLLTRNYGHNHYAAFLILVTPIFWWQLIFVGEERWISKKEIKFLSIILLILSYIIIFVSLSRISLLIFLLQLIFVFFISKKLFSNFNNGKLIFNIIRNLIIVFLFIAAIYLLLPLFVWGSGASCPSLFEKKELCQPFIENIRFSYWKTALLIFKENLPFGSGLKTFNFFSRHFPSNGFQGTSYAHNIILHNLAEGGVIGGGFFIIFVFYTYYKSFLITKNKEEQLNKFLWISAISSFINALFDYDWHFFVIFSLTLIFLAIILQSDDLDKNNFDKEKILKIPILKTYFIVIAIIANFFSFAYMGADILRKQNHPNEIIKFFPYFDHQISSIAGNGKTTLEKSRLNLDDYEKLWFLYKNDPNFILKYLDVENLTSQKKFELLMRLADLDHKTFLSSYSKYKPIENMDCLIKLANKKIIIVEKQNFLSNHEILTYTIDVRKRDAMEFLSLADRLYKEHDYETSSYFYNEAYKFYPKIYNNKKLPFEYDENIRSITEMLLRLDLKTDDFELYGYDYDMQFIISISEAWKNNDLALAVNLTKKLNNDYRYYHLIFKNILEISNSSKSSDRELKKQNLISYHNIFKDREEWNLIDLSFIKTNKK